MLLQRRGSAPIAPCPLWGGLSGSLSRWCWALPILPGQISMADARYPVVSNKAHNRLYPAHILFFFVHFSKRGVVKPRLSAFSGREARFSCGESLPRPLHHRRPTHANMYVCVRTAPGCTASSWFRTHHFFINKYIWWTGRVLLPSSRDLVASVL